MANQALKSKYISEIRSNTKLFSDVAILLDITPASLLRLLNNNHSKLIRYDVLQIVKKYTGVKKDTELLEEVATAA